MMQTQAGAGLTVPTHRQAPSPLVVVAAIVALLCIAVGALVIGEFAPHGANTAVVTGFVLGTVAPTVMGLLALLRGDHAVQVGQANADRLEATTAQIAAVAQDVNGHLDKHDDLAVKLTDTADTLAKLATARTPLARVASERTRADDPPAAGVTVDPAVVDTSGLDPAQG